MHSDLNIGSGSMFYFDIAILTGGQAISEKSRHQGLKVVHPL
jgi:hypothetical protein